MKKQKSRAQGARLAGMLPRTTRRVRKQISQPNRWPSLYWIKTLTKDPATNKTSGAVSHCHMNGLAVQQVCKPEAGSKLKHVFQHVCACLGLPEEGTVPFWISLVTNGKKGSEWFHPNHNLTKAIFLGWGWP